MAEQTVYLEIQGMTCNGCAQAIERHLKQDRGVKAVSVDWTYGIAEVTFDPSLTHEERILENRIFQRRYKARLGHPGACC